MKPVSSSRTSTPQSSSCLRPRAPYCFALFFEKIKEGKHGEAWAQFCFDGRETRKRAAERERARPLTSLVIETHLLFLLSLPRSLQRLNHHHSLSLSLSPQTGLHPPRRHRRPPLPVHQGSRGCHQPPPRLRALDGGRGDVFHR